MNEQISIRSWQLNQNSASAYEQYLVGHFFRRWAMRLVEHAHVSAGERALDAGCGTGIVSRTLAQTLPEVDVTGMDPNEGMLAEAQKHDARSTITWRQGAMEQMPFDDASFELVLNQQVLQFVSDRPQALREMHRVLIPGGRTCFALLRDIRFNPSYEALAGALDRQAGREAGEMMRSPFAGPSAATLRTELAQAGFRNVSIQHDILDVRFPSASEYLRREAASSPLAGPISELDEGKTKALIADVEKALEPFTDDRGIAFPMETYLVDAERV